MAKKIKLAAVVITLIAFVLFVFAPVLINKSALAAESKERDWDRLTSGGTLRDSSTVSSYAVLMDAHTGEVLYEENGNHKRYPASITKIMTCLVVLENANLQATVTVSSLEISDKEAKKNRTCKRGDNFC